MITIPEGISNKLVELDMHLHQLGQNLYSRKIYKDYEDTRVFTNFHLELHRDGSFTLHFVKSLLGYMDSKDFSNADEMVLDELELLLASIRRKLEKC